MFTAYFLEKPHVIESRRHSYIALGLLLATLLIGLGTVWFVEARRTESERKSVAEVAETQAHLIQLQLLRSLGAPFVLAAAVRQGDGQIDGFNTLAAEVTQEFGGLSSVQLAPNAVVEQIYPLKGNEEAIGHDLLQDPERRDEALAAIRSKKLTLAGPFDLIQGGKAVVGRLPVFLPEDNEKPRFWGFTIALIHIPFFLEDIDIDQLERADYDYQLSKIDPKTGKPEVFARSTKTLNNPVRHKIGVPNATWDLAVAPKGGWHRTFALPVEIFFVLLISGLAAFTGQSVLGKAEVLRNEVALRTRELANISERQRHIADTLQHAILAVPQTIEGLTFGSLYRSATEAAEVGGDFYDLFPLDQAQVGIVMGDISGKGLEAAALTSLVKDTIKAYSYQRNDPASVLASTNEAVARAFPVSAFATIFFVILDIQTGSFVYASAGHPPAIVKSDTGRISLLESISPVAGVFTGLRYVNGRGALRAGDVLILYTDGVTEARRGQEFYGEDNLIKKIEALENVSPEQMPSAIFEDVMQFAGGTLSDDVALVALSIQAPRPK